MKTHPPIDTDILVIGGGAAGSVAAIKAKEASPQATVTLLEKADIRRSGNICMGMDGLNNAVIPGHATPENYVKEITMANDGIVNQKALLAYAERSFSMVQQLEQWGVKFQKTATGDYDVKKVHHLGSYLLPMPEGYDLKKILSRTVRRSGVRVLNRVMATRILTSAGRVTGVAGFHTRTGEFVVVRARAVILCCGPAGRLGLPATGYLWGTYENPANAGDGYAMAYHAGAELTGIECFQINPLIKDYNGPACAYVTGPYGGYTVNNRGHRFIKSDYWSGQMMLEFFKEMNSERGPVYLKLDHLAPETIAECEDILHKTERPSRGRFHAGRGLDYRRDWVEMHISEIGLCSGHSASGVWVNERGETTLPGLYAAGDVASVPHNYLLGAMTCGWICAENAVRYARETPRVEVDESQIAAEQERLSRHLRQEVGLPPHQVEYKIRRFVNDYLQPPKSARKLEIGLQHFLRARRDVERIVARDPHELMRAVEVGFIRDCAELAARASLFRTESRWGLFHWRLDYPNTDNEHWLVHVNLKKGPDGEPLLFTRTIEPYLFPLSAEELLTYHQLRIPVTEIQAH